MSDALGLTGVSETLLIPLCCRARETRRSDGIIRDDHAVRLVESTRVDCGRYCGTASVQIGVAVRTAIVDGVTRRFLAVHPDAAVVNLGAGLCTRFFRVDDGRVLWLEVDLPPVEAVWRRHFARSERHDFVAGSVLDARWMTEARERVGARPVLLVAEGLMMYFTEAEVRQLLGALTAAFPGADLVCESVGPLFARHPRLHPSVAQTSASFRWGVASLRQLEGWGLGVRCVDEWYHLDVARERWGALQFLRIVPQLRREMKIGHLRLAR